jgi:DNA-binding beta-propeller fold protein YncE
MTARAICAALALAAATLFAADEQEQHLEYRPVLMFNQHLYFGTFNRPSAVAYDVKHHELWMADDGSDRVAVFLDQGAELFAFSSRRLRGPQRIAVAPDGSIVAVGNDRAHLRPFNYRGAYQGDVALAGADAKIIIGAMAYDAEGNLYVADNRAAEILVYRPDGSLKLRFGSRGGDEGQFQSVSGIAIAADGTIAVADQRAIAVQLFDSQGNFVRGWGRHEMGAQHFSLPAGIVVDSASRVIVADELRHQVKVFDMNGTLLTQFGGLGDGLGQLAFPTAVTVDDHDRIYVAERSTARVQVFEPVP